MLSIDGARLWRRLEALAAITEPDTPWTRRAFSPMHQRGRAWLADQFAEAGLATTVDAAGNLIGRLPGGTPGLKPIVIGSHSDTVTGGGRYDGILGVLAGLEIAQTLASSAPPLRHPLAIVDFLCEEPSDFGLSCIGSRGFVGALSPGDLALTRGDGLVLAQGIRDIGGNPDALASAAHAPGAIAAYLELHIEQGRVLESEDKRIGVVTDIVGILRRRLIVEGQADHAGTTPMTLRRDAMVGAAALIEAAFDEGKRRNAPGRYVVATIGRVEVSPNAANAVPGRVEMVLEVRSNDAATLDALPAAVATRTAPRLAELGLALREEPISLTEATFCDPRIQHLFAASADALGLPHRTLSSGAGHDAMWIARIAPYGMIFIPCLNGRSHCAEESITASQATDGARTLGATLLRLDQASTSFS